MQSELASWDDNGETLVRRILSPYVQTINDAIEASWKKYLDIDDEVRYPWEPRTRANVVNNYICYEIKHRFANITGISIIECHGFLVLNFFDLVLLRFKMLDKNYRAGNILTRQQRDYDDLLELPNLPQKAIRVIAGYLLDKTQTQIRDILVTRPFHRKVVWKYPIFNKNISIIQPTLTIENDIGEDDISSKRTIKPKKLKEPGIGHLGGVDELSKKETEPKKPQEPEKTNRANKPSRRTIKPKKLKEPGRDNINKVPEKLEEPGEDDGTAS
jgi:hypothetical protein